MLSTEQKTSCFHEVNLGGPLDSFRMGAGHQKDSPLLGWTEHLEIKQMIDHVYETESS